MELKDLANCRVVAVAHFNISEAEEFAEKGVARRNGVLWDALIETETQALPKVDVLIFVSEYMSAKITARIDALRFADTRVIPNFTLARNVETASAIPERHAISIGSLEPRKNQQFLIRVIAECKKSIPSNQNPSNYHYYILQYFGCCHRIHSPFDGIDRG